MWCQLTGCFLVKDGASLLGEGARRAPVVQAAIIVEVFAVVVAQGAAAVSRDVQSPAHLPPALASEEHGPDERGQDRSCMVEHGCRTCMLVSARIYRCLAAEQSALPDRDVRGQQEYPAEDPEAAGVQGSLAPEAIAKHLRAVPAVCTTRQTAADAASNDIFRGAFSTEIIPRAAPAPALVLALLRGELDVVSLRGYHCSLLHRDGKGYKATAKHRRVGYMYKKSWAQFVQDRLNKPLPSATQGMEAPRSIDTQPKLSEMFCKTQEVLKAGWRKPSKKRYCKRYINLFDLRLACSKAE